jgi:hypothetical protein
LDETGYFAMEARISRCDPSQVFEKIYCLEMPNFV